jgi:hypothetical protein
VQLVQTAANLFEQSTKLSSIDEKEISFNLRLLFIESNKEKSNKKKEKKNDHLLLFILLNWFPK